MKGSYRLLEVSQSYPGTACLSKRGYFNIGLRLVSVYKISYRYSDADSAFMNSCRVIDTGLIKSRSMNDITFF